MQLVQHLIDGVYLAAARGDNQLIVDKHPNGDQLIGTGITVEVNAAQRDHKSVAEPADARTQAVARQRIAHRIRDQRRGGEPLGALPVGIVKVQPTGPLAVDNIFIFNRDKTALSIKLAGDNRIRYL